MKKITLKVVSLIVLLFSTHLVAITPVKDNSNYIGVQNSNFSIGGIKTSDILIHLGKYLDGNTVSIETRLGFGIASGSKITDNIKTNYKTNLLLGAYLTKYINIDTKASSRLYGFIGYTLLNYSYIENGSESNNSDYSPSAGIGFDFRLTNHTHIALTYTEYNKHIEVLGSRLSGIGIGMSIDF